MEKLSPKDVNICCQTTKLLQDLTEVKNKIQQESSKLKKKNILKEYSQNDNIKKIFIYIYSDYKHYNITSKQIKKYYSTKFKKNKCKNNLNLLWNINVENKFEDIFVVLDELNDRKVTGHKALDLVCNFIEKYEKYKDIIFNIIDKNLEIRINVKTINSVFPKLIPSFEVALAELYDKHKKKVSDGSWYISRKMDGIRCIIVIYDGNIKCYSRLGKELFTLGKIKNEIKKYVVNKLDRNVVFDGELCIIDNDGNENFKEIMKHFRKKEKDIDRPKFKVFDCIRYEDFIYGESKETLSERLKKLEEIIDPRLVTIDILKQQKYTEDIFNNEWKKSNDNNWEGLILRKDTIYKAKRSNDMLKVKKFNDAEFTVLKINIGPFRILDKIEGKEKIITTLTSVEIEYKNNIVNVGSGFTLNERDYYMNNSEELVGNKINVRWFEEIETNGKYSLRFPTYKGNYGKQRIL